MNQTDLSDRLIALENQLVLLTKTVRSLREEIDNQKPEMKVDGWNHIPVQERARMLLSLRQNQDRSDMGANRWPELLKCLEVYQSVTGKSGIKLGDVSHDRGTLALVVLFDAGYSVDQICASVRMVCKHEWWLRKVKDGKNPGLSNFTPEVVRRSIDSMSRAEAGQRLLAIQTVSDPNDPEALRRLIGTVKGQLRAYVEGQLTKRGTMSKERIEECCGIYWRKHTERVVKFLQSGATAESVTKAITAEHQVSDKPIIAPNDGKPSSRPPQEPPQRTIPALATGQQKAMAAQSLSEQPHPKASVVV